MRTGRLTGFAMIASAALFISACGDDDCDTGGQPPSTTVPTKTSTVAAPPTATQPPAAPTRTFTSAPPTATQAQVPATSTPTGAPPTATQAPSEPTSTPTSAPPTPTIPSTGGTERVFSIGRPASQLKSSGLGGFDVTTDWSTPDPLILVKGDEGDGGVSPLSLKQDVIFSAVIVDGSRACVHLKAAGSGGFIDCDGGSAAGVTYSVDSHGADANDPPQTVTGQGGDAGAGAALLTLTYGFVNLPAGAQHSECATAAYDYVAGAFTTGSVQATVLNAKQGGEAGMEDQGVNFNCASWETEDSAGVIITPVGALDTIVGDLINMLVLSDPNE